MRKSIPLPWVASLVLVVALVLVSARSARSVYASPVNVINPPTSPVPVMDTRVTSSAIVDIAAGHISGANHPAAPTCPAGTDFLVSGVYAAPDWFGHEWITSLGRWSIRVGVMQKFSDGSDGFDPILVYGTGPQHASVVLPAGQPTVDAGSLEILALSLDGAVPSDAKFIVHVSGYCGTAFLTP